MSSMSFCLFPSFALRDSELVMSYLALGICRVHPLTKAKFCYCVRFNPCLCSSSTLNIDFFICTIVHSYFNGGTESGI